MHNYSRGTFLVRQSLGITRLALVATGLRTLLVRLALSFSPLGYWPLCRMSKQPNYSVAPDTSVRSRTMVSEHRLLRVQDCADIADVQTWALVQGVKSTGAVVELVRSRW